MASKLKVEELRDELSKRGLSTTGIKPTLVRRLEAALRKEAKQQQDSADLNGSTDDGAAAAAAVSSGKTAGQKRERDGEEDGLADNEDGAPKAKLVAVERFRQMSVKELRAEATARGVSTGGAKKELVERLCEHEEEKEEDERKKSCNGDGNAGEVKEEKDEERVEDDSKKKLVKATVKGSAVLDRYLPDHLKNQYHVMQGGDFNYDAMLNQTNVGDNNNKFYVIQALESDGGGTYMVYNRWGRVGVKGQDKLFGPYTSREAAVTEFEQKLYVKTKNFGVKENPLFHIPSAILGWKWITVKVNRRRSRSLPLIFNLEKLNWRLLLQSSSLFCNIGMMKQQMMEIGYNAEKLPLGKFSKSTISKVCF